MRRAPLPPRPGLSRVEAIVLAVFVVVVIGIVVTLVRTSWDHSNRLQCMEHLKRIGDGTFQFSQNRKHLPASCIDKGYATWAVQIAEYLFQKGESQLLQWDMAEPYHRQVSEVRQAQVRFYYCPARRLPPQLSIAGDVFLGRHAPGALGDYACSSGDGTAPWDTPQANGAIIIGEVLKKDDGRIRAWIGRTELNDRSLVRGLKYTILYGEKHVPRDEWGKVEAGDGSLYNGSHFGSFARFGGPNHPIAKSPEEPYRRNFGSAHPGICHFLYAEGEVKAHSTRMDATLLGTLTNRFKQ